VCAQNYGGRLFRAFRDELEDVFCKLPPPKSARRPSAVPGGGGGSAAARSAAPIDMSMYNNRSNPCFAGRCRVKMADGRWRRVDAIRKGDVVASSYGTLGTSATVRCVVRTETRGEMTALVRIGELLVTPWHPVRLPDGQWEFPWRVPGAEVLEEDCEGVYNFVLDAEHAMVIEDVACITLSHGVRDGPVAPHPYFGSGRVIEDLSTMVGWAEGFVQLQSGCALRDATGLICGLVQRPPLPRTEPVAARTARCSAVHCGATRSVIVCGAV
jgi:hypothetical protein